MQYVQILGIGKRIKGLRRSVSTKETNHASKEVFRMPKEKSHRDAVTNCLVCLRFWNNRLEGLFTLPNTSPVEQAITA